MVNGSSRRWTALVQGNQSMRTTGSSRHAQTLAMGSTTAVREAEGRPASGEVVQQRNSFCNERQLAKPSPPPQEKYRSSSTETDAQQYAAGTQLSNVTKTKEEPCRKRKQISSQDCPWASALKETQIKIVTQMSQMWKEHRIENQKTFLKKAQSFSYVERHLF